MTKGDDEAWWFGFDCGHAGDVAPGNELIESIELIKMFSPSLQVHSMAMDSMDTYRDLAYCTEEVKSLAKQLKQVEVEGFRKCQKKI